MTTSYAITVCNEEEEIQKLLPFLFDNIKSDDEIVVLFDSKNGTQKVRTYLNIINNPQLKVHEAEFNNHFADWKNLLNSYCTKDFIFQIDADEIPNKSLVQNLKLLLLTNKRIDLYYVPRVNTVEGLTQEHINKWRWFVDEQNRVNFPDYQRRIYRNSPDIKWENKVHEVIKGHKKYVMLPPQEEYCLYHPKTIERQEKQNNLYDKLA